MSDMKPEQEKEPPKAIQPGFCSATCVDRESLRKEIAKPELKTSDLFVTCNLPKRFEHPRESDACFIIYIIASKYFHG